MKYICGLDIGSSKISASLGGFNGKRLNHLWWDSTAASGVKRGQWQDVTALTAALSNLMKNIKTKSGVRIKSVYLCIASQNIVIRHSQAVIALAERGNKSVTRADIRNVNHQAQILGSCLEDEILHTEPLSYTVDNENEVIDPLGLYGHQLKVDLYLISVRSSYINTIIEVINRLGLKINEITISGLAASQAVFNNEKLEGLNILCDIGKDITQITIFNEGRLIHYQIICCGGDDLTNSVARELKLPYSLAEEIKVSHGRVQNNYEALQLYSGRRTEQRAKDKLADKEIIVKKGNAYSNLSQNLVIQILSRASSQVARKVRGVILPCLSAISLPSTPAKTTLYVSGRTACLEGFLELLEVVIGLPVKMANVNNSSLLVPLMRHRILSGEPILKYLASLGLVAKAIKTPNKSKTPQRSFQNILSYIPEKVKQIYQEYF